MDLMIPWDDKTDAIGEAKTYGKAEVATLLERFKKNPEESRYAVRMEPGLVDEVAAEVFAMVVFVSDGLLQIKETRPLNLQPDSSRSPPSSLSSSKSFCAIVWWALPRILSLERTPRLPSRVWLSGLENLTHLPSSFILSLFGHVGRYYTLQYRFLFCNPRLLADLIAK